MSTHSMTGRFDSLLWDRTLTGDPLPLAGLVGGADGTRSEHIVVETVIVEDTNPLETLRPTKHAVHLHTAGAVTVMKVDHPDGAFTISAWPTQYEGVFHLIAAVPATDRRWRAVDGWILNAAPATVRCFLDHDDFINIGTALSEFGDVEVQRASGRMRADRSSYNRGFPALAGTALRPDHHDAVAEFEAAGASLRSLTLHVGEVMDVSLRRIAGATFTQGDFAVFESVVLNRLAVAASRRRELMSNRERHINEPAPASIQVRLPVPTFVDAQSTGELVNLFEKGSTTSKYAFAVMHRNPYLHVVVSDEQDGSNYDVFVTETDIIEIRPGFRATMGSLNRLTALLGDRFSASDTREAPLAEPVSVFDLISG